MSANQRSNLRIAQANHARNIRDNFKCCERAYTYLRKRGWTEEGAAYVVFGE
jgi:hypothetical protein